MSKCAALLSLALSLIAFQALALPAPMNAKQLADASDLVALVRVVSVTCTGVKTSKSGKTLHQYKAMLELLEVEKGDHKAGDIVETWFTEVEAVPGGAFSVFYFPGEEVKTHLRGGPDLYEATWWNARGDIRRPARLAQLPESPGETLSAQ
jgi:hypothetical protein